MAEKILPEVIISGDNQPASEDNQSLYAKIERNITGSWDNYGELEHLVGAGKMGNKGKVSRNTGALGYDICFYASSEYSGGIAIELYSEESLSRNVGSDLNTGSIVPKVECEGYIQASTGGLSTEMKDGGIYTTSKTVVVNKATVIVGGVNLSAETETDLDTKKTKVNTQVSIGKGSSPGVKSEIKRRQSLIFASGEKNLKGP